MSALLMKSHCLQLAIELILISDCGFWRVYCFLLQPLDLPIARRLEKEITVWKVIKSL